MNQVAYRSLSDEAIATLKRHDWPGNVRELENTLHRAVLLAHGDEIGTQAILLPDGSAPGTGGAIFGGNNAVGDDGAINGAVDGADNAALVGRTVAEVEKDLIIDTLRHCLGNRTHAANILGISIRTLRNKLNLYQADGTPVPSPGESPQSAAV